MAGKLLTKLFFVLSVLGFLFILEINLFSYDDGITGLTKKTGGVGCICHGNGIPHPEVTVNFIGPDSVATGQTVIFRLRTSHGPEIAGGLDVAVYYGRLNTTPLDTIVRKDTTVNELTHRFPKPFTGDTVSWTFLYTAPLAAGHDTLYAVSNSVNGNGVPDTGDHWNFSSNYVIRVYLPIGIVPISTIAESFSLSQNYPNPFNPSTQIEFTIPKESYVEIKVFDIKGAEVARIVNENLKTGKYKTSFDGSGLSSGVYFYRITAGKYTDTKKMILVK
jgi:hypothetical protein